MVINDIFKLFNDLTLVYLIYFKWWLFVLLLGIINYYYIFNSKL